MNSDTEISPVSIDKNMSLSFSDLLNLCSMQAADINRETEEQHALIVDGFTHLHDKIMSIGIAAEMKPECMKIIELLQYSDRLKQRLEHLEQGISLMSDAVNADVSKAGQPLSIADSKNLLMSFVSYCSIEQEQVVIHDFLNNIKDRQDSINAELHR